MTLLPVVGRELGVAARRAATYWMRFAIAAGALAIFFVLFASNNGSVPELGEMLFTALGIPALGFAMLAGVFLTADSLSVEKREGTLGLLFLTDLKGYDVVLGKMAANCAHAYFGLLAVFPVLSLPLLMGGVSVAEFWRTVLVFCCTLYFSLSIGMLVSALSHEGRQAMAATFGALMVVFGVLPLMWGSWSEFSHLPSLTFLLWPNPVWATIKADDGEYLTRAGRREFWTSIGTMVLLGTACMAVASWALPRWWRKTPGAEAGKTRGRWEFFSRRPWKRPEALGEGKPFYWLAKNDRAGGLGLGKMMLLLLLLWAGCAFVGLSVRNQRAFYGISLVLVFALHFTAKVLLAAECGRRFHQDRQSGAMELLLVTPLTPDEIVAQQEEALRARFQPTLLILIGISLLNVLLVLGEAKRLQIGSEETGIFLEVLLGGTLLLWLDARALIWLGMWKGLTARTHPRSVLTILAVVLGIPWLVGFVLAFVAGMLVNGVGAVEVCAGLWYGLGALVDVIATGLARESLRGSFRSVVAQG